MSSLDDLRRELGGDPPPAIAALDDVQLELLAVVLKAAREHQAEALAAATESGLGFVPRLLRGPVKKLLFG